MSKFFNFEPMDNREDGSDEGSSSGEKPDAGGGCVILIAFGLAIKGIAWGMEALSHYDEMVPPYSWIAAWYYFLALALSGIGKLCLQVLFWPFFCRYSAHIRLDCLIAIVLFLAQLFGFWLVREIWHEHGPKFRLPRLVAPLIFIALIAPALLAGFLKAVDFLLGR